jgi:hypothetical protein
VLRLHDLCDVKTFLPIWKLTEELSPCIALVKPRPGLVRDGAIRFQSGLPMLAPAATMDGRSRGISIAILLVGGYDGRV